MVSKEKEVVKFAQPVECTGAVESYLNKIIAAMRSSVRALMRDAVETYEEKPREEWLRSFPAQIALVGCVANDLSSGMVQ